MKQLILHNKNKQYNNLQIWSFFIITSNCKMETCNFKRLISKNGNTADAASACGLRNDAGLAQCGAVNVFQIHRATHDSDAINLPRAEPSQRSKPFVQSNKKTKRQFSSVIFLPLLAWNPSSYFAWDPHLHLSAVAEAGSL